MGYFNTAIVLLPEKVYYPCERAGQYWEVYIPQLRLKLSSLRSELSGRKDYKITYVDGSFKAWIKVEWSSSSPDVRPYYTVSKYNKDIYFNDLEEDL